MPNPSTLAMDEEYAVAPPSPPFNLADLNALTQRITELEKQRDDLAGLARAVVTFLETRQAFEDATVPSDTVTEAAALAACELETQLETHATLFRR